jgi:hypothetical protein
LGEAAGGALAAPEPADDEELYSAELAKELRAAAKAGGGEEGEGASEEEEGGSGEEGEGQQQQQQQWGQQQPAKGKKRGAGGEEEEMDLESMKDIMMTRKTRKFYERIKRSQQGKRERVDVLEERKAALQKKQKK